MNNKKVYKSKKKNMRDKVIKYIKQHKVV